MPVRDECIVLHRFRSGELGLTARVYCKKLGLKNFFVPDYFSHRTYRLGAFEPFNFLELYLEEKNGSLQPTDLIRVESVARRVASDFFRYGFLSSVAKTILKFVRYPDEEIFNLLRDALKVRDFFDYNLVRFWLSLSTVLGFSVEKLNRAGWVNAYDLGGCAKEEIGKGYCIFVPPKVLHTLKRVASVDAKPFKIPRGEMEKIEKFFGRFLSLHTENF